MGRSLRALIGLAMVGACNDAPAPGGDAPGVLAVLASELLAPRFEGGPGFELVREHRHAVEEAMLAEGAKSHEDAERIARRVTKERLVPAIETLHRHAHWLLQQQPRAERLDLDGWSGTGRGTDLGNATRLAKPPASEDERLDRIAHGWNAIGVAYMVEGEIEVQDLDERWRWPLAHWAPADTVVVGDDLDAPTIVLDRAHELSIVRLQWDAAGFFVPVGYDRYVRASPALADPATRAAKGDLAARQGPGYSQEVELHRATQLAVAAAPPTEDADARVREIAFRVAAERLPPHVDVMRERARWTLRRWLPPADRAEWTDTSPATSTAELAAIVDEMIAPHPPEHDRAARMLAGWEPLRLANMLQWELARRRVPEDQRMAFYALQAFTHPQWVLVEDDPDAPAIGFEGARERTVVRLRWDPQGWYVPVEAQLQRRAAATSSP